MAAVNRYQRGEIIGKGGMGTVYRGLDGQTGLPVALKFLLPELAANNPDAVAGAKARADELTVDDVIGMLSAELGDMPPTM